MNISVVIPAYNEEKDIKGAVLEVVSEFPDSEIIVVNDASTDNTLQILNDMKLPNLKVLTNLKNMGHGYSVINGLKNATNEYILYIDADRQIPLASVFPLEGNMKRYDFISGYRVHRSDKLFRKVISFCLKMTNVIFHGMYIRDANCPFKIYKREKLIPLLDELPKTYIVPIACLEVIARKHELETVTIPTPHYPYNGVRKGFLQILNKSALKFFSSAFFEVVSL